MNGANDWRRVWATPSWSRQAVCFFGVIAKEVLNRARNLPQRTCDIVQIHFIVSISDFVGEAACPGLDLIELELFFVVSRLANIDLLLGRETTRSSLVKSSNKHDKASVKNFASLMVPVLTGFDDFVLIELLVEPVDGLLRSIVPASVEPAQAFAILPNSVYLSDSWFCEVIGIANVNPISWKGS